MKFSALTLIATAALFPACFAQQSQPSPDTFAGAVNAIMSRPEFRRVSFGVEVYSLDRNQVLYSLNGDKFFTPASTTKLLTEGTMLHYLGPDYRFHTPVYRTGPVKKGVLDGDLVIVASGDPDLSDRLQPDGTLAFANIDHTYGGPQSKLVPGDPAAVMNELAKQVREAGIRSIHGQVEVDTGLFPEGVRELGTGMVISPICVNDNTIDATVTAGSAPGQPAQAVYSLHVPYINFVNQIATAAPGTGTTDIEQHTATAADGTQVVTLSGTIVPSDSPFIFPYPVSQPSRFAAALFAQALEAAGVSGAQAASQPLTTRPVQFYTDQYRVAEHISAPFSEEAKVTLKVSQNLHASMMPYLLGAVVGKASNHMLKSGFALEHAFLVSGGLDTNGASQGDGAGGAISAYFTPDFMVHYLAFMSTQKDFAVFHAALPILGRDGTLYNVQTDSPAAGKVFAKTGTFGAQDRLNDRMMLVGKGLAGYTTTPSGEPVSFALYLNHLELPPGSGTPEVVAGDALGAIAAAIHDVPIR